MVRLIAENPGAPWPDLRRRVFTVIEPVAPLVPFFQQVSVPPQACVTEDIPIRWQVSGASKITLHWTHAGTTCEQELPPSGETQIVATSIAPIDLRFTADPALPTFPGHLSAPDTHDMREQPICRRIEIHTLPPRIEVSRQVIRGHPLSHQALAYQIHDASEAWLIRPHRNQTTEIRLAGVMSFWLGTVVETITIMARSESGEESIKVITLHPYKSFFRRIFDVSL